MGWVKVQRKKRGEQGSRLGAGSEGRGGSEVAGPPSPPRSLPPCSPRTTARTPEPGTDRMCLVGIVDGSRRSLEPAPHLRPGRGAQDASVSRSLTVAAAHFRVLSAILAAARTSALARGRGFLGLGRDPGTAGNRTPSQSPLLQQMNLALLCAV